MDATSCRRVRVTAAAVNCQPASMTFHQVMVTERDLDSASSVMFLKKPRCTRLNLYRSETAQQLFLCHSKRPAISTWRAAASAGLVGSKQFFIRRNTWRRNLAVRPGRPGPGGCGGGGAIAAVFCGGTASECSGDGDSDGGGCCRQGNCGVAAGVSAVTRTAETSPPPPPHVPAADLPLSTATC